MQNKTCNRFLLPLLFSICISTSIHAQSFNQQEQIVQQPIIKMFDALSNSDTAVLKLYTTRDVKFYEYGQVWPRDTLIHKMLLGSRAADFKRKNSFEFVSTTIDKNIAWVTYYVPTPAFVSHECKLWLWDTNHGVENQSKKTNHKKNDSELFLNNFLLTTINKLKSF